MPADKRGEGLLVALSHEASQQVLIGRLLIAVPAHQLADDPQDGPTLDRHATRLSAPLRSTLLGNVAAGRCGGVFLSAGSRGCRKRRDHKIGSWRWRQCAAQRPATRLAPVSP